MRAAHLTHFRYMLFIIMLTMLPVNSAYAQRDRVSRGGGATLCSDEEPKVIVKLATSPTKYYKNYDARSINAIHNAKGGGTILGLAGGPLEIETRGQFSIRTLNGKACVQIKNIEVMLWTKPAIIIASNFKKGTCEYNEILAHEERHHETNVTVVETLAMRMEADMPRLIAMMENRYVQKGSVQDEFEKLKQSMSDALDIYLEEITIRKKEFNALVDTPQE